LTRTRAKKREKKKRNWLIRTRIVNAQEKRLYSRMIVFMHVDWSRLPTKCIYVQSF